jgi:thiamine-monophosphate kinase
MSGEFQMIAEIFAPLAEGFPGAFGLLDDAAVVVPRPNRDLVVTKDLMVAGVHFPADDPARLVGKKLLRVNLSDLAAMGADPIGYLLGIALPKNSDLEWLKSFAGGLAEDQAAFGVALIGGDTVQTPGPVTVSLTAFGDLPAGKALTRARARDGDLIMVSGTIGDGTLGLGVVSGAWGELSELHRAYLLDRFRVPEPRLALGQGIRRGLARSAADVSDGLIADLGHIGAASGLGAVVKAADVPLSDAARAALDVAGPSLLPDLLSGGDDYELVFTVARASIDQVRALGRDLGISVTEIGRMVTGRDVQVVDGTGRPLAPTRRGYRHF